MKTIKLLLCILLTAMSFNLFADDYEIILSSGKNVWVLNKTNGLLKNCYVNPGGKIYCNYERLRDFDLGENPKELNYMRLLFHTNKQIKETHVDLIESLREEDSEKSEKEKKARDNP